MRPVRDAASQVDSPVMTSLAIAGSFIIGVVLGRLGRVPDVLDNPDLSVWTLYLLIFIVGVIVGLDRRVPASLRSTGWKIVAVPCAAIVGTAFGVLLLAPFLAAAFNHVLAVGFGLGYYSLSSILIGQIVDDRLALVALLANVVRELITVTCAPVLVRFFGPFAPILAGGATTMDTTLPAIIFSSGREYVPISVFNSAALTLVVPALVIGALSL